jgi:hypothetical protein
MKIIIEMDEDLLIGTIAILYRISQQRADADERVAVAVTATRLELAMRKAKQKQAEQDEDDFIQERAW